MRAMNVIVLDVFTQDLPQVPPAGDQHQIQALAPGAGNRRQAFRRHRPREQRQPCPVRPRQTRVSARPLTLRHCELMARMRIPASFRDHSHRRKPSSDTAQVTIKMISLHPAGRRSSSHALAGQDVLLCAGRPAGQPAVSGASGRVAPVSALTGCYLDHPGNLGGVVGLVVCTWFGSDLC